MTAISFSGPEENYISHYGYWQRHKKHIWDSGGLESGLHSHNVVISRYKSRRGGECWTNRRLLAGEVVVKCHSNYIDVAISFFFFFFFKYLAKWIDFLKDIYLYSQSKKSLAKTCFFNHTSTLIVLEPLYNAVYHQFNFLIETIIVFSNSNGSSLHTMLFMGLE